MNDENGFIIHGWMVNRLGLSGNELIVYAIIYSFSQDGESCFYGSLKYIEKTLSVSKPTAIKVLQGLLEKGLIQKHSETRNSVIFNKYKAVLGGGKESLPGVKNIYGGGKESLPGGGKDSLPYKKENNISNNNSKATPEKSGSLFPESDPEKLTLFRNSLVGKFEDFEKQFKQPEFQEIDLFYYFNSVSDWSDKANKKRTARGWIATARDFMRGDNEKGKLKKIGFENKSGIDPELMAYLKM